nr:hypothetical protein Itr_chr10CG19070 [Ipomoea trifida]
MTTTRDSHHCYHYCYCYDRDYDRDCVPEIPEYCPCIPLRIGASLGHEIIENRYNGKMVEKCCKYCKLCNPPRAEARTQAAYNVTLAAGDSYHCYHYCYCYDNDDRDGVSVPVSPECCPCIPLRIGVYLGHEIIESVNNGKMVEKCCEYCKLCNPPRAY